MDHKQLRELIIHPSLVALNLWSPEAEALVLGTAIQESGLRYLKQIEGPALGLWQMEPATHEDIWENFLNTRRRLSLKILGPYSAPDASRMVWDMAYACMMCRVHYARFPGAIPATVDGQALYWKKWYNTHMGAGTIDQYLVNWHRVMA